MQRRNRSMMISKTHFWRVRSPVNNIDEGDVSSGGFNRVNCPSKRASRPATSDQKYSRSKLLTEQIVDVLSMQPTTTFQLAMKWLEGFYGAISTGKLEDFTGHDISRVNSIEGLSQVSSVGDVTLSQLSFVREWDAALQDERATPQPSRGSKADEVELKIAQPIHDMEDKVSSLPQSHRVQVKRENPPAFAPPPKRKGLSRRTEKQEVAAEEMRVAKRLRSHIAEGRKARIVDLGEMTILSGSYSRYTVKPLVDRLYLPPVEVEGTLDIRRLNPRQPVPCIAAIPQLDKILEAIELMSVKGKTHQLARWDDYGFATHGQLLLMADIIKAKNNFNVVEATMTWIDTLKYCVDNIVQPFKDVEDVTKAKSKQTVDQLNLGVWYVSRHAQYGSEFLDFRENLWLHSASIIGGLLSLRESYEAVGIVNPRFHEFDHPDQKMRTAKGYGATAPGTKRVISAINLGYHWGAFFVNLDTTTCYLFDPLQLNSNLSALKRAVATVVEPMFGITDQLSYEVVSGCVQKDSSSCGIWCLVVLELLLFGATPQNWNDFWNDSLYDVVGYLRMRYLYKVIALEH